MSKYGKGESCHWCKRLLESKGSRSKLGATKDHVLPKSQGGRATVWACRQCNAIKGDMHPDVWRDFMAANPEWWLLPQFKERGRLHKQQTFYARDLTPAPRMVLRGGFWVEK